MTNKIIEERDDNGNLIYYADSVSGLEFWQKFDEEDNRIELRNSDILRRWQYGEVNELLYFYDDRGNVEYYSYWYGEDGEVSQLGTELVLGPEGNRELREWYENGDIKMILTKEVGQPVKILEFEEGLEEVMEGFES